MQFERINANTAWNWSTILEIVGLISAHPFISAYVPKFMKRLEAIRNAVFFKLKEANPSCSALAKNSEESALLTIIVETSFSSDTR